VKNKSYLVVGNLVFCKAKTTTYVKKETGEDVFSFQPIEFFYLEDIYDKLCSDISLSINIKDISESVAYSIKECVEKSKGKIPLTIKIVEENNHFFTELSNMKFKVDPENFVNQLQLFIDYEIKLQ
jgi:hypothetical protein